MNHTLRLLIAISLLVLVLAIPPVFCDDGPDHDIRELDETTRPYNLRACISTCNEVHSCIQLCKEQYAP